MLVSALDSIMTNKEYIKGALDILKMYDPECNGKSFIWFETMDGNSYRVYRRKSSNGYKHYRITAKMYGERKFLPIGYSTPAALPLRFGEEDKFVRYLVL